MAVSYEILFARAQNQLLVAKISCNDGIFGVMKFTFFSQLADLMLNPNTPS